MAKFFRWSRTSLPMRLKRSLRQGHCLFACGNAQKVSTFLLPITAMGSKRNISQRSSSHISQRARIQGTGSGWLSPNALWKAMADEFTSGAVFVPGEAELPSRSFYPPSVIAWIRPFHSGG